VILHQIAKWIDKLSNEDDGRVLWLHGPAGAGKSAIAQTIAEAYARYTVLAANFFFSRDGVRRNVIDHLFATIAYHAISDFHIYDLLSSRPFSPTRPSFIKISLIRFES